jgi:hypothetical protein
MIQLPTRASVMVVLASATLGLAGCSGENGADKPDAESARAFDSLFSAAFEEAEGGDDARLAYEADPGIRRASERQMASNLSHFSLSFVMPDAAEFLRSGAAGSVADRKLAELGLPSDSLAGATVLMFGLAWELANQKQLTPDDQRALLKQVHTQLQNGPLRDLGDSARQREADARLLTVGVWLQEARLRQGSPEQMQALSDAVQKDMIRWGGNDMRAQRISADGFKDN